MSVKPSYINYFNDYTEVRQSLFLGSRVGLIENMRNEFPKIWDLYKQLKSLDWDENEIDISSCRNEFKTLPQEINDLMIRTLAWQFEADSSAAHVATLMMPFVNNTEMICYLTQLMGNECLTPEHEVLTPKGWIRIDELNLQTQVAQWSQQTKTISYVHPSSITEKLNVEKMYRFYDEDGTIDQTVTANHRMPLVHLNPTEGSPAWMYAKDVIYSDTVDFPVFGQAPHGLDMTPQERLWVAISMEAKRYTVDQYLFQTTDPVKLQRLKTLTDQAGWSLSTLGANTTVTVPQDWNIHELTSLQWVKPHELSYEWAHSFISEIQNWGNNTLGSERASFVNGDQDISVVMAVARLGGYHPYVQYDYSATDLVFAPLETVSGLTIKKEEVDYTGKVYCVTVPDSYFLVRHNNVVQITGNCLHSLAYKVIVENSFDNPEEFLKTLLQIKESFQRLDTVKRVFDETYEISHRYALGEIQDKELVKRAIFKFWVTLLALERIQFMSSFAITFGLAEQGYYVPIGKLVQKIFNEEFQVHVKADKVILQNELAIEDNFSAYLGVLDEICEILKEIISSELTWTDFLFGDKEEIGGIRKKKIKEFVLYSATDVYMFLGIENPFQSITENPLPYMNKWAVIDANQSSPQEESVANYLLGNYVDDSLEVDMTKYGLTF